MCPGIELARRHAAIVRRLVNSEPLLARNIETKDRQLLAKSFDLVLQGNVGFRSVHLDLRQRVPDHPATVRAVPEAKKSANGISKAAVAKASQLVSQWRLFAEIYVVISTAYDINAVASRTIAGNDSGHPERHRQAVPFLLQNLRSYLDFAPWERAASRSASTLAAAFAARSTAARSASNRACRWAL